MPRHVSRHIHTANKIGFCHNNKPSIKYTNNAIIQNKCDKHAIIVNTYSAIINMANKTFNMRVCKCIYMRLYMCVCVTRTQTIAPFQFM